MKHPGKTKAQREALDQIGCGNYSPRMAPITRDAMLAAGLIRQCGERVVGRDRFGVIAIPEYEMTIPTHMAWCKAVASEEDGQDKEEGR